ncbi:MAG: methionine synthase [Deltaproteobacteria bacterium]|nr:methionine synthase [Deltaproteobacteria bacterium]
MSLPVQQRVNTLKDALARRILVLDGSTGVYLQTQGLTAADFGGGDLEGCNENLVLTRPDVISAMHAKYLEAGCDIVETDTFGGTPLVLDEYGLGAKAREINRRAAELAREQADRFSTPQQPRFVCGSMGPTTKSITVTGGVTFEELVDSFRIQTLGLSEGGCDYLLIETAQDTRNIKAALEGIHQAFREQGYELPVAVSGTIEPTGTMLAGQGVEALAVSLAHEDLLYIGLNCATGPSYMTDHVRSLAALAKTRVAVVPNAGLPDEDGCYLESPAMMVAVMKRFVEEGWVNLVGGCCGTTPDHIRAFAEMARGAKPRQIPQFNRTLVSGIEWLEITDENRPIIVGERTNAVGSKLFRDMIAQEKFEEAAEIAKRQVEKGAQIIDVNLANPDRDEKADMERFLDQVIRKVKVPLMIDSTDPAVIAQALPWSQGKCVINSINLEDGEERFEQVVPLARRYGAALIVGTIDEDPAQSMAVTRQRKLAVAQRSYDLLTKKYGVDPTDIIFDPLVFPCATGDENYIGSAAETIEGLRLIKQALPLCKTILGVSNVSFGLPPAGREVLNAVFLYHCVQAGLDMAIVNAEKLVRYGEIPEEEKKLADDLLFNRGDDPVAAFAAHFRAKKPVATQPETQLPLEERLARYIVRGVKDGLAADLELARQTMAPLDIINGPLMAGMEEVGRQFNANKLIVAEVLQSAEAMKAAVSLLEPHMEKTGVSRMGTMLLATVKGDVHDIGKNLVDIIFTNNGFRVVNLGIKVPPEQLVAACKEHKPDLIGLSGLLVKSAQQMIITAQDLTAAGIATPMLVGGAALSQNFTKNRIGPAYQGPVVYAQDAMKGLDWANKLRDPAQAAATAAQWTAVPGQAPAPEAPAAPAVPNRRSSRVRVDLPIPPVEDTRRHVMKSVRLDDVWAYLNPQMLYGKHLGLKGNARDKLAAKDPLALELKATVDQLMEEGRRGGMKVGVVWQFFQAKGEPETNRLTLTDPAQGNSTVFQFPRQQREDGLALPDFVLPANGGADHVAALVVTAGEGIRQQAEKLKQEGAYLKSHALQALALETAEAAAEWLHARLRAAWGFPDGPEQSVQEVLKGKYRGARFSFGYAACPELADQEKLFALLNPADIGVQLTEGYMMEPEASVSALVFHHPDAMYFAAGMDS